MRQIVVNIILAAVLVTLLFVSAIVHWGWNAAADDDADMRLIESRPTVPYSPLTEQQQFHGAAVQVHNPDDLPKFKQAIREVADTGADTLLLSMSARQEHGGSSVINLDFRKAPNREQTVELINLAHSLGMRVIIMPLLLLEAPRGNEWRGKILPEDQTRWWADYREFIKIYAQAACEADAEVFMIGSELNRMEGFPDRWRSLIQFLRQEYSELKLGYSANWDRYWKVDFWNALDYAGVTTYYTLADHPEPTVREIYGAWQPHKRKLIAWQRTVGLPVIFTEVGWYSRKGAATQPWNYYHNEGKPSQLEQANLYQAFLDVWAKQRMLGGIIFWEWTLDPGGPKDETYTPKGKLAEKIMRDYFREHAHPTTRPDANP